MDKYKRKRLKVSSKICKEYNLYTWDRWKLKTKLWDEFKIEYTSKRNSVFYFRPCDEQKLAIFFLKYGEYILS